MPLNDSFYNVFEVLEEEDEDGNEEGDLFSWTTESSSLSNFTTIVADSGGGGGGSVSLKCYTVLVPIMIGACLVTFLMNALIIAAFPLVRNLSRVTRPYITFILSLVISDAFASFLLGFQLLAGSYLPVVHDKLINICFLLVAEALKLTGILCTVFHLLSMVSIHLAGVVNPVRFKERMTLRLSRVIVVLLWLIPFLGVIIPFSVVPDQGFQSPGCRTHSFLSEMPFRAAFSGLIVVPTAAILALYASFHVLLWRRRDVSKSSVSRQNIRAARVTFLIMLTCVCGWIPAVTLHLLICTSGCIYHPRDFSSRTLFIMHAVGNVLVILKSLSNPLIFAFRQHNIQRAVIRLLKLVFCCEKEAAESAFARTRSSMYSSFTRSSTNRDRQRSNNNGFAAGAGRGGRDSSRRRVGGGGNSIRNNNVI